MLREMLHEDPGGPPVAFAERMGEVQAGVYLGESVGHLAEFKVVPCSGVDAAMNLTQVHVHAVVITEVVDIPAGTAHGDVDGPELPGPVVDVSIKPGALHSRHSGQRCPRTRSAKTYRSDG